jgi:hypothetical protein
MGTPAENRIKTMMVMMMVREPGFRLNVLLRNFFMITAQKETDRIAENLIPQ